MQLVIFIPLSLMGASSMLETTTPMVEMKVKRSCELMPPNFLRLSSAERSMVKGEICIFLMKVFLPS